MLFCRYQLVLSHLEMGPQQAGVRGELPAATTPLQQCSAQFGQSYAVRSPRCFSLQPLALRCLQPVWEQSSTKVTPERVRNAVDKFTESLWKVSQSTLLRALASNTGRNKGLTSSMLLGKPSVSFLAHAADMSAHFPAALQDSVQLMHAPHVVAECTRTRGVHARNEQPTDHASCCLLSSLAAAVHLCCVHCSGGMVSVGPALGVGHMAAMDGLAQPTLYVSAAGPSCSMK